MYSMIERGEVIIFNSKLFNILIVEDKESEVSTEFVSLSEWMHESTLFNIITKLHFFKNFAISKPSF